MDETTGFPIPSNRSVFGEGDLDMEVRPLPESDFIIAFPNEDGTKAVLLTTLEVLDGEVIERHGRTELEQYAQTLLETGEDPLGLQVGDIFEGENAEADAQAEAFRLDDMFNPGEGASDAELAQALEDARVDAGIGETTFPEGEGLADLMEADEEVNAEAEELAEEGAELDEEVEPMLEQLKKRKK